MTGAQTASVCARSSRRRSATRSAMCASSTFPRCFPEFVGAVGRSSLVAGCRGVGPGSHAAESPVCDLDVLGTRTRLRRNSGLSVSYDKFLDCSIPGTHESANTPLGWTTAAIATGGPLLVGLVLGLRHSVKLVVAAVLVAVAQARIGFGHSTLAAVTGHSPSPFRSLDNARAARADWPLAIGTSVRCWAPQIARVVPALV